MNAIVENIFTGENKYTTGLIMLLANLAAFFFNMRKRQIKDLESIMILVGLIYLSRLIV
jgi:hypothetical protein